MQQLELFIENEADKMSFSNDEYNLGFIGGKFGSGKTAFLAYLAYEFEKEYEHIFSNFHIDLPNGIFLEKLSKDIILDLNEEFEEGDKKSLMLLQESYNYFDKRYCMKKENKGIQTALFQIRKMGIDIFGDIPAISYLDMRSIENGNIFYQSLGRVVFGKKDEENYRKTNIFVYQDANIWGSSLGTQISIDYTEFFEKNIYETMEKTK